MLFVVDQLELVSAYTSVAQRVLVCRHSRQTTYPLALTSMQAEKKDINSQYSWTKCADAPFPPRMSSNCCSSCLRLKDVVTMNTRRIVSGDSRTLVSLACNCRAVDPVTRWMAVSSLSFR